MIDFPNNPTLGQTFDVTDNFGGIVTYTWDGVAWTATGYQDPPSPTIPRETPPVAGDQQSEPDFPDNPNVGDEFDYQGNTWVWDGTAWVLKQASGTIGWDDITDKPDEFPPTPHTHVEADITDLDKYSQLEADVKFVDAIGDSMTGFLTLNADPTAALHAATKQYVDANAGGGGASVTYGDNFPLSPTAGDLHYLTQPTVGLYVYYDDGSSTQWVQTNGGGGSLNEDIADTLYVNLDGDVMTGPLSLSGDPTTALQAATKQYVDANGGGVTDHGALTGLADDDHTQYHTDARGDARYVNLTGDTMTAALNISNASFVELLNLIRGGTSSGFLLSTSPYLEVQLNDTSAARIQPDDETASFFQTIMTRRKGDARYVLQSTITDNEFHDPLELASWRIIGTTLECWGTVTGVLNTTDPVVTFPKVYATDREPVVTLSASVEGDVWAAAVTTTQLTLDTANSSTPQDIRWYAIGEWDGIS